MDASIIANLRLSNQQLIGTTLKTPEEIVSWMGAVQAQDFNMSKWALGVRVPVLTNGLVEDALNKGKLVRTHILRPTWHLVAGKDIHWMLSLSAPRLKAILKTYAKMLELTEATIEKGSAIIERALSEKGHLTRPQLGEVLKNRGIDLNSHQLNHIMFSAELHGVVCNGEISNGKQTYCLLEEKIPKTEVFDKQIALERLARKYFTSHAPATLQDFVWWSGLPIVDARAAMEMIKSDFVVETIDSQQYWINNSFTELKDNDDSLVLLPAWDEFVVSYKNRQHIILDEHYSKVISKNGIFKPVIVKGGQIVGMWKRVKKKEKVIAETQLFGEVDGFTKELIKKASNSFDLFHAL